MRKIVFALAIACVALGSASHAQGKRVKLFDGKTLKGWHGSSFWSVVDGAIHGTTEQTKGELIFTDADYSDFRLILKSRLVSESNHLGVCMWGERTTDFRYGNCTLVIPPNDGMWDYTLGKAPEKENPPHEKFDPHVWNETEILAYLKDGTIRVATNGVETTRYKDIDPSRLKVGPIGLQIHSGASTVEYKDIEIEVNPKEDRLITLK